MKIIASDFDGTFNHGGIDEEKRDAVKRWQKAGNLIGLVSGRGSESINKIASDTGVPFDFLVANNGAVILGRDGRTVKELRGDGSVIVPMVRFMLDMGTRDFALYSTSLMVIKNVKERCKEGEFLVDELPEIPYFTQISAYYRTGDESAKVAAAVREKFGEFVNPLQNGGCLDIVPAGVDKAVGIRELIKLLGARESDVIAVGDNVNDEAMIREFRSYAMDNAVPLIKELADETTPNVTELIRRELI